MSNLVFHSLNDLPVGQRNSDGYINATAMCKAAGKQWGHYFSNATTKEFLNALSENLNLEVIVNNPDIGNPTTALVEVFRGGNSQQGTWIHPQVAVHLAMWLSPQFSVMVTQWVVQWMSGKLQTQPQSEPKSQPQPQPEPESEEPKALPGFTEEQISFQRRMIDMEERKKLTPEQIGLMSGWAKFFSPSDMKEIFWLTEQQQAAYRGQYLN